MKLANHNSNRKAQRAFTMIEIAISIGIIGFALVAIIGILPRGMNVQKDNREDTIISQDAPYFLNAMRDGEMRTNRCVLTNYVETIIITNMTPTATNVFTYNNPYLASGTNNALTNDMAIIGFLSTPEFDFRFAPGSAYAGPTNIVTAIVRAMSGSALEQDAASPLTVLRYQMTVEIAPWNFLEAGYVTGTQDYMNYMAANLHEIRLRFAWPVHVLPNGTIQSVGDGRQTYRSMISSRLTQITNSDLWFFQSQNFSQDTNSFQNTNLFQGTN